MLVFCRKIKLYRTYVLAIYVPLKALKIHCLISFQRDIEYSANVSHYCGTDRGTFAQVYLIGAITC